jgi:type I restriction enzyme S subunit
LEDAANEITVGYVGPMADEYQATGIPFFRSLNIKPFRVETQDLKFISAEFHHRIRKSRLRPGDVVIVRTGAPGTATVIPDSFTDANSSDLVIVHPSPKLNPYFLAYLVNAVVHDQVAAHVVGAVQQHFNIGSAKQLMLRLPPRDEQDAIADALHVFDRRLELNRQMNRTLEDLAAALFRSWFVDFDPVVAKAAGRTPFALKPALAALFSATFQDSELGPIPQGWRVDRVAELARLTRGGINPGQFPTEVFDHYSIPAFDDGHRPKKELGGSIKSTKFPVPPGCVMVSKLNPDTPRIWLPDITGEHRAVCSTEFLVCTPKPPATREFLFSLFSSEEFTGSLAMLVTGTSSSHQRVKLDGLLTMEVIIPDESAMLQFARLVRPWFSQVAHNERESVALAALRDTLLPKLLSGEIRVRQAEKLVEART